MNFTREVLAEIYKKKLAEAAKEGPENGHMMADDLLCELLKVLGYEDVVTEFEKVRKWYA